MIKVASGSLGLFAVQVYLYLQGLTANQGQYADAQLGSQSYLLNEFGLDAFAGLWLPYQTEMLDQQDPILSRLGRT